MSAVTELAFTGKVKEFYDEQVLIPVRIPLPLISDPEHGYFSEIVLPPDRASEADVVLLGFPIDIGASYRMIPGVRPSGGSPSEGSMGVRRGLGFCRTYAFPLDVDLKTAIKVADLGNIFISNTDRYDEAFGKFSAVYQEIMKLGATPLVMGGDNSTTYISFKNFAEFHNGKVGLIWLDAHTDTADNYRGDRYWCGSPMARILELPSSLLDPGNVVMLGIRGFDHSAGMIRVALEAGVHMIPAELVHERVTHRLMEERAVGAVDRLDHLRVPED